ncbi:hypothetical protein D3C78_1741840 [compost metagenome]
MQRVRREPGVLEQSATGDHQDERDWQGVIVQRVHGGRHEGVTHRRGQRQHAVDDGQNQTAKHQIPKRVQERFALLAS